MTRVIVVGAGVVGLTTAVRLLEAGHRVDVLARDLPLETTSAVAAALWYPYLALPQVRVGTWASRSYEVLAGLAGSSGPGAKAGGRERGPGVRMVRGTEVRATEGGDPWWAGAVPDLARVEVPGYAEAWTFTAPVVEMPVHLRWLRDRVDRLGGTLTRVSLAALPVPHDGVVVNCSGLGSRLLGTDSGVHPVRGQVAYLEQVGLDGWWLDASGPTYVVPRRHDIVVGGTEERDEWSRSPEPATTAAILERACSLVPRLRGARMLGTRVGLRPARPEVRVERTGDVVHCYGHGGAGVTLSWGCAEEVVRLVG